MSLKRVGRFRLERSGGDTVRKIQDKNRKKNTLKDGRSDAEAEDRSFSNTDPKGSLQHWP